LTIWKKGATPTPSGWLYDSETVGAKGGGMSVKQLGAN
jgi:hypothetical protein